MASYQEKPEGLSEVTWGRVLAYHDHFVTYYSQLFKDLSNRDKRLQEAKSAMKKVNKEDRADIWLSFLARETLTLRARRLGVKADDFELQRVIGRGGTSNVFLAEYKPTGKHYALKRIAKYNVSTANQALRIRTERAVMTIAENDFIVKCRFCFQDDQYVYLVMDLGQAGDFGNLLQKIGGFSARQASYYFAEMVCALDALHEHGFIHRDLKPSNFLIKADGHLLLCDFGFSKGMTHVATGAREQLSYSVVGTAEYIAPEVFAGTGYTSACDLWSLGCILYEMLSGVPPFTASSIALVIAKIRRHETDGGLVSFDDILEDESDATDPDMLAAWDMIARLLCPAKERTITLDDIKAHPYLAHIDWGTLAMKKDMPFVPELDGPADFRYFGAATEVAAKADDEFDVLVGVDLTPGPLSARQLRSTAEPTPNPDHRITRSGPVQTRGATPTGDQATPTHIRSTSRGSDGVTSTGTDIGPARVIQFESRKAGNNIIRSEIVIPSAIRPPAGQAPNTPWMDSPQSYPSELTRQRSLSDPKLTPAVDYGRCVSPGRVDDITTPSFIAPSVSSRMPYPSPDPSSQASSYTGPTLFRSTPGELGPTPVRRISSASIQSVVEIASDSEHDRAASPAQDLMREIGFVTEDAVPDPSRTMHRKMVQMLRAKQQQKGRGGEPPDTPDAPDYEVPSREPMTIVIKPSGERARTPLEGGLKRPRVRLRGGK